MVNSPITQYHTYQKCSWVRYPSQECWLPMVSAIKGFHCSCRTPHSATCCTTLTFCQEVDSSCLFPGAKMYVSPSYKQTQHRSKYFSWKQTCKSGCFVCLAWSREQQGLIQTPKINAPFEAAKCVVKSCSHTVLTNNNYEEVVKNHKQLHRMAVYQTVMLDRQKFNTTHSCMCSLPVWT